MTPDQRGADARLAASRDRLRLAMCMNNAKTPHASAATDSGVDPLLALQKRLQGLGAVCNAVAKATVAPMAQKHPWGLVASAFVVGGALVLMRPWRWVSGPALVARLLPLPPPPLTTTPRSGKWTDLILPLLQQVFIPRP